MNKYYITFGRKYHTEPHPILGICCADGYVVVEAPHFVRAHLVANYLFGDKFANIYNEGQRAFWPEGVFPAGEIGFFPYDDYRRLPAEGVPFA
jgi:hypothetical protein